ncbi:hypothetical protein [Bacillus sp. CMF12]|nr:hypothetical protein [Bacillus sp. CMF12]
MKLRATFLKEVCEQMYLSYRVRYFYIQLPSQVAIFIELKGQVT